MSVTYIKCDGDPEKMRKFNPNGWNLCDEVDPPYDGEFLCIIAGSDSIEDNPFYSVETAFNGVFNRAYKRHFIAFRALKENEQ